MNFGAPVRVTPPRATPQQIRDTALALHARYAQGGLAPRSVTLPRELPRGTNDRLQRAVSAALLRALGRPSAEAQAARRALGIDPQRGLQALDAQAAAYEGLLGALTLNQGARDARRLVGAGRVLARTVVKAKVQELLGVRDEAGRDLLEARFRPVASAEALELERAAVARDATRRLTVETEARLKEAGARQQLLRVMDGLSRGERFDWGSLVEAASLLDGMLEGEDPPPTADDRRGSDR